MSVRSRLRDAGAGEMWAGQIDQSGVECVVRRVRLAPDPVLRSAALGAARTLAELEHPHLVPILAVVPTPDGLALLTEPVVGAVSLARLLTARGNLDPGEVVTVGLPIAQALAAAHAAGLVHGRLEREDILLEPTGRPVLVGLGVASLAEAARPDPIAPGAAAADVHDLATLLLESMREATGPDAAAVAVAVATALIDDPMRRPAAGDLASALARSATPLPVRFAGDAHSARQSGPPTAQTLPRIDRVDPAAAGSRDLPVDPPRDTPDPGDARPRLLAGARLDPPPDDADEPETTAPRRGVTGATAVDARELLDSLPPPPRRSTSPRRSPRATGRPSGSAPSGAPTARPGGSSPVDSLLDTPSGPGASPDSKPSAGQGATAKRPARPADGRRTPRRIGARRRRWLLPATAGVGLFAVVVAAVLLLTSPPKDQATESAGGSPRPTASAAGAAGTAPARDPTASPVANQTPEQIWRGVLAALNTARSRAFEQAQESLLAESDAPGSEAYNADVALMRQVVAQKAHTSPLRTDIVALEVREDGADRTVLRVTDRLQAYDYLDAQGKLLQHQAAREPEQHDLVLVRTQSGWRVSQTLDVTSG
ncbi:protein kinase [Frankia canadensis]|uniref:protein kinase n=1 Tax=Frankia canadensis TaxID=1836972 RepID=UPI001FAFD703|nr:protein kinase [Frankia canadensis]